MNTVWPNYRRTGKGRAGTRTDDLGTEPGDWVAVKKAVW